MTLTAKISRSNFKYYLLIITGAVLLGLLKGFYIDKGDLDTYIPFALHSHDNTLLRNDLLTQTIDSHPVYIWKLFGYLLNFIPLKLLFTVSFIFQTILITVSLVLFYQHFFGKNIKGLLLFLLFFINPVTTPGFGRLGINPYGYFHASAVAMGLALLIFVLLDRKNWVLAGILAGFMFLFHPITATFTSMVFLSKFGFEFVQNRKFIKPGAGFTFLLLISSPSWVQQLSHMFLENASHIDPAFWRPIMELRMAHGLFVSKWPPERFLEILLMVVILLVFCKKQREIRLMPFLLASGATLLLVIVADLLTIKFLIQLQLGRMMLFLWIAGFGVISFMLTKYWEGIISSKKHYALWTLVAVYAAYGHSIHSWNGIAQTLLIIAACLTTAAPFLLKNHHVMISTTLLISVPVILICSAQIHSFFNTYKHCADSTLSPLHQTMVWCKDNTGKDEIIMIPFYIEGFRCYSKRSIYVSYKDGAPHNFCDKTFPEWWRRMQLFGIAIPYKRSDFPALYHEKCMEVALSEDIGYVVYEKSKMNPPLEPVYENQVYGIIRLED